MAVGWGFGDIRRRDHAAAAGAVLDQHRLAHPFLQLRRHRAQDDVDAAAGRERHNERDWPGGIVLRQCAKARLNEHADQRRRGKHGSPNNHGIGNVVKVSVHRDRRAESCAYFGDNGRE